MDRKAMRTPQSGNMLKIRKTGILKMGVYVAICHSTAANFNPMTIKKIQTEKRTR